MPTPTPKPSIPYAQGMEIAEQLRELLLPGAAEIVIAGSLRRNALLVKDIELVVCLHSDRELRFAQSTFDITLIRAMQDRPQLRWDTEVKRNGEKYKRFVFGSGVRTVGNDGTIRYSQSVPIDCFITERPKFGNILAIRTGNAAFSHALVTPRSTYGLMPDGLRQGGEEDEEKGYLWRGKKRIDCPTEADFFRVLELPHIPPDKRDEDMIKRLRESFKTKKRRAA